MQITITGSQLMRSNTSELASATTFAPPFEGILIRGNLSRVLEGMDDVWRWFVELFFELSEFEREEKRRENYEVAQRLLQTSHLVEAGKFRATCVLAETHDRALSLGVRKCWMDIRCIAHGLWTF